MFTQQNTANNVFVQNKSNTMNISVIFILYIEYNNTIVYNKQKKKQVKNKGTS